MELFFIVEYINSPNLFYIFLDSLKKIVFLSIMILRKIMKEGHIMQWQILVGPIVGALIGYVTNKIAVEMLFRPLKPIYIGKFHLPFTPGIIPKGQERLGKAIGNAVGNNLLTPAIIKETLLSEKIENDIVKHLDLLFTNLSSDESSLEVKLQQSLGEAMTAQLESSIKQTLTQKVRHGLVAMNFGEIVAGEVLSTVQAKVQGTMLAMMLNASTIAPIVDEIKIRVNQYIEEQGEEKVGGFVNEEFVSFMGQPISSFLMNCNINELKQIILNLYRNLVNNYAEHLLGSLNLSKIVEEKVCAMETRELKDLVLSIMKKELGAVVNLGALIGFILGLLNLLF
jgi:uncharacterized membrane protein YheB (UPF0754 family)